MKRHKERILILTDSGQPFVSGIYSETSHEALIDPANLKEVLIYSSGLWYGYHQSHVYSDLPVAIMTHE